MALHVFSSKALLMIDGSFGFEMETFEFLNMLMVRMGWVSV